MSSDSKEKKHDSAVEHVTGKAVYVDDRTPIIGQLHVAIGGAQIAHGVLESLDLSAVWSSEGVVDVISYHDLPAQTDIGPVFPGDPLLLEKNIECFAQAVFAVAATSHKAAQMAVKKARMTYQEMEPVLSVEQAHQAELYVRPPHRMQRGDAATALLAAPHRIHRRFHVGGQEHFYLEGQVALAVPEEDGGVTVHSSNQNPTEAQHLVAGVLGIAMHKVTLITRRMGGGFGGKETQATTCCALASLFAVRQQVPVSCRLSRRDDMLLTGKRHPFLNAYDVGFDDNGKLLAVQIELIGQCGFSADLSDAIVDRAMFHCDNSYSYPHVQIDGIRCKTHTASNTAFRGFGGPQGMLVAECMLDDVAYAVGKDPLEVRRLNLYQVDQTEGLTANLTPYHQSVSTFTVPRILDELERSADYQQRKQAIRKFNQTSPVLKRGIALTPVKFGISFTVSHLNQGGALVHLYSDGSVQLNHGGTEMGQGLMRKVQQVVATVLGMQTSRIAITATRTDKVPNTSPTAASSGTDINGMAAANAAEKIKQRLIAFLVDKHQVEAQQIEFIDDAVRIPSQQIVYSWPELANVAYMERIPLSATGFYKTPKIHYDRDNAKGRPFLYFANGAAATEVVIDTLTGESKVLRCDILHDVGDSINPAIDRGQIEGGYIQGLGWLTTEELKWSDSGRLLSDGPATYKIPAISDAPDVFNTALLSHAPNEEPTILRSKAVGEPPFMLAISAFNAIRDAVASVADYQRFPCLNAPATPEEILRVCDELRVP